MRLLLSSERQRELSPSHILLERLYGTLCEKITQWNRQGFNKARLRFHPRYLSCLSLWNKRIQLLFDVAGAMRYLHSNNILLRDLKTENVGFDKDGNIKLFDFGLASELQDDHKVGEEQYNFSIIGGTMRYMSPEAMYKKPHGKSSDVYSFALLAWETMALQVPFKSMTSQDFIQNVFERHHRPKLYYRWPKVLKRVLLRSWATDPNYRPSFVEIEHALQHLVERGLVVEDQNRHAKYLPWLCRFRP